MLTLAKLYIIYVPGRNQTQEEAKMRNVLRVVTVVIVLCFAQFSLYSELGVKLGFQRTEFEKEGTFDLSTYKIGFFYSVDLGDNFSFQPEFYFSHHGTRTYRSGMENYYFNTESSELYVYPPFPLVSRQKLSYIEVPLLLKYTVPFRGDLKPVLYIGGYVALRVSKKFEFDYMYDSESALYSETYGWRHIDIQYKQTDRGGILGVGLEHGMGKTRMHIDFRVNIGFVNVYEWNINLDEKQNRSMSLLVGLSF